VDRHAQELVRVCPDQEIPAKAELRLPFQLVLRTWDTIVREEIVLMVISLVILKLYNSK